MVMAADLTLGRVQDKIARLREAREIGGRRTPVAYRDAGWGHECDRAATLNGWPMCWQCYVDARLHAEPDGSALYERRELLGVVRYHLIRHPEATNMQLAGALRRYSSAKSAYTNVGRRYGAPDERTYTEAWALVRDAAMGSLVASP